MTQAIVSVLAEPYCARIEDIWGELSAVFGLKDLAAASIPHVTYQWADSYDAGIETALARIADATAPFQVRTRGLGIFRGAESVVYLALAHGGGIARIHERLWRDAAAHATGVREYYAPATWVPHITLASGDLRDEQLPDVLRFLGRRQYEWTVPISNLCLVPETAKRERDWQRYELGGVP